MTLNSIDFPNKTGRFGGQDSAIAPPLDCGLRADDFAEAEVAIAQTKRIHAWWDAAPPPAIQALIITLIARGKRDVADILERVVRFGGKDAADTALRLIASTDQDSFWTVGADGTLQLTANGARALHQAYVVNVAHA